MELQDLNKQNDGTGVSPKTTNSREGKTMFPKNLNVLYILGWNWQYDGMKFQLYVAGELKDTLKTGSLTEHDLSHVYWGMGYSRPEEAELLVLEENNGLGFDGASDEVQAALRNFKSGKLTIAYDPEEGDWFLL